MRTFMVLALTLLLTASTVSAQVSGPDASTASELDAEEATLRKSTDAVGRLDLLLFLHAFRAASPARDEEIVRLKNELDEAGLQVAREVDRFLLRKETTPLPYDGTDESLIPTLRLLSASAVAISYSSSFYAIPCSVLAKRPGLLAATKPYNGGNRDNWIPRSGCGRGGGSVKGYPTKSVRSYVETTKLATGNWIANYEGSNRFTHAAYQNHLKEVAMLDPAQLASPSCRPYETWSYLSLSNRRIYAKIMLKYETAHDELTKYWTGTGRSAEVANEFANKALFALSLGAGGREGPPPRSLRTLLMDGAPLPEIDILTAEGMSPEGEAFEILASRGGDPLILIAVGRPESLSILFDAGLLADVNAQNGFGKTALMVAAQIDSEASVIWLIEHGADVNATTAVTDDKWEWPKHGQRTALHYAVSEAHLPVILALVDAGADSSAVDDEGSSVIDYLNGNGPVMANNVLNDADRAEAERLLPRPVQIAKEDIHVKMEVLDYLHLNGGIATVADIVANTTNMLDTGTHDAIHKLRDEGKLVVSYADYHKIKPTTIVWRIVEGGQVLHEGSRGNGDVYMALAQHALSQGDRVAAEEYFAKAAEYDDPDAIYELAIYARERDDLDESYKFMERAFTLSPDDLITQLEYARYHIHGWGTPVDEARGFSIMKHVADEATGKAGAIACMNVAWFYEIGIGVEVSQESARAYLDRAIKYGYTNAEEVFKETVERSRKIRGGN